MRVYRIFCFAQRLGFDKLGNIHETSLKYALANLAHVITQPVDVLLLTRTLPYNGLPDLLSY